MPQDALYYAKFRGSRFSDPLSVVAHDAGAANLIIGWVKEIANNELRPCLSGPAHDLWTLSFGEPKPEKLEAILKNSAMLISGTSYKAN